MRSPILPLVAGAVTAAMALSVTGCSGSDAGAPCPTPQTAPATQLGLLPAGLSFEGIGTVTKVVREQAHITAFAVSSLPLEESTVRLQDAVVAAGYRPAGMDNEGFEAEVFFTQGTYAAGQALVRKGACDGQWDVELTLIAAPRTSP